MKPKKQPPQFLLLFKEQPLLVIGLIIPVIIMIILIVLSGKHSPKTTGDTPAKDSRAYLVYQEQAYFPMKKVVSDNLFRADIAYFARQTMKIYDPNKNPGVVLNISSINQNIDPETGTDSGKGIDIIGTFEKAKKEEIHINIKKLANDRVDVSIINAKSSSNINDKLPSKSKENKFIETLPVASKNYRIDYVTYDGSVLVTIGEKNPAYIEEANQAMRDGLKSENLGSLVIGYSYPTDVDYGDTLRPVD